MDEEAALVMRERALGICRNGCDNGCVGKILNQATIESEALLYPGNQE